MRLTVPDPSLIVLVGPSGCGKSTFARRFFRPTEIVSSDQCRALVCDDASEQGATSGAFAVLHTIVEQRLAHCRLTVVDATNVQPRARKPLVELAHRADLPAVAIVLDLPEPLCVARAASRPERTVDAAVVHHQREQLHRSLDTLRAEGFREMHLLRAEPEVDAAEVVRAPLPPDRRSERGPFDIVGDVHGCADELRALLTALGWAPDAQARWRHPEGRRLLFLGDLVDRGPHVVDVLRLAMDMVESGVALCVPGNHDDKLARKLRGRNVRVAHGLELTLAELEREPPAFRARVAEFVEGLPSHLVLDGGRLVVAHAGMRRELQGRDSRRVRDFALYGETTGEIDEYGLPVRRDWAASYHGRASIVYGHTPVAHPEWRNHTINIDTGCVFGGRLTALRYPENDLASVPARRAYAISARPFPPSPASTIVAAPGASSTATPTV